MDEKMCMENLRNDMDRGKQKFSAKIFSIKALCTGLETNPGIRVEMPDTKGLSHGTAT